MADVLKVIGMMSGTSLDGVDAAILETDGETVARPGQALTVPYGADVRAKLVAALEAARGVGPDAVVPPAIEAAERMLTQAHADAVGRLLGEAGLVPKDIAYLGFHEIGRAHV